MLVARGDGVVSIVDNRMPAARSVLQRWTLVVRVPSARSEPGGMHGCSTITVSASTSIAPLIDLAFGQ